jgi:glycosyltransferase involved in cell wall biosynthesis
MKILSISTLDIWPLGKGKGIPSVFASQKGFVERGYEVHFICPLKKRGLAQKEDYEGIHIFRFRLPFNLSTLKALSMSKGTFLSHICVTIYYNLEWLFFQAFGLYWLLKFAFRIKPDLIYVHSPTPAFFSWFISKLFKTKLVIRVYGIKDLYWRWGNVFYRIKEVRNYAAFKIPADYFIITDDGNYGNRLAANLGVPGKNIRHWRNGVDQSLYEQDPSAKEYICNYLKLNPSSKIIASTCRLIPCYGVDKLLHAFADLHKKNPDAVCLVAGDGPEKQKLEAIADKTGISSRVFFTGTVDRQMVKKILYASDIFVLLARYHNCTNTMWEAMACGKCIITTETEAIQDVLTSNADAVLVPPEAFEKVPGILNSLLSDEQRRRRLGENARLRARQVLESWPQRIEKEAELLEDLVKESR